MADTGYVSSQSGNTIDTVRPCDRACNTVLRLCDGLEFRVRKMFITLMNYPASLYIHVCIGVLYTGCTVQ